MNNGGIILCLLNAYSVWFVSFWWSVKFHFRYSRTSTNGYLSTKATLFDPGGEKSIHWLFTTATLFQCPQGDRCREVQLYQNLLFFDCIRSHGHCLLQEYSHEYAACKSDIVIVWSSSRVRLAQYICDIIHPTDLMIPNSRILFITRAYLCTQFHSEPVVSRIFNCST